MVKLNKFRKSFVIKVVALIGFNLILVGVLAYFLMEIPKAAEKINTLRNFELRDRRDLEIAENEIIDSQDGYKRLQSYYPNEDGVFEFIAKMDELKRSGDILEFDFVSGGVLRDRSGSNGLAFSVKIEGDWGKVRSSIQKIEDLPYVIRAVRLESSRGEEGVISLNYGGFLYVAESY